MTRRIVTDASAKAIDETVVQRFEESLRGEILWPGDAGFDSARKIHNGMIDRRPAMIVRCSGVADVLNAVDLARSNDLLVSVRCGGHGVPGFSVCEGGMMIDLSPMKSVRVDQAKRTARAEGGVTWGELDHETQAFGLATTGGVARPTGVAGLTLGGGHGFLMRQYGLACDNLVSIDVATADGRLLTASATENADLFWGVRGGGGNFGIATSFEYRLHPVGPLLAGRLIYAIDKAKDVLGLYREVTSTAPDELGSVAALATLPDGTPAAAILVGFNGPIDEGERILKPLRQFGPPISDEVRAMAYTELQSFAETFNPPGLQNHWKSNYLKDLSNEAIGTMVDLFATAPALETHMVIENLGGAVSRVGRDETAFNHRDASYNLLIVGMWTDAADNEKNVRWVREAWEAMQSFSSGAVYVNYLGQESDEGADRLKAAYGPEKYERLVALKNKYDPTNLFRLNQNIRPTV